MKNFAIPVGLLLAAAALSTQAAGAGDPATGQAKSAVCAACHGADGNSTDAQYPKLAGQHEGYIVGQLRAYQGGTRKDPVMAPMTAALNEQDMADVGAHFAAQAIRFDNADAKLAAAGERLYRGGNRESGVPACAACHGPRGTGNASARFPALSGQHPAYVTKTLKRFRAGHDAADPEQLTADMRRGEKGMMGPIAARMTDAEITAVAQYVAGLR